MFDTLQRMRSMQGAPRGVHAIGMHWAHVVDGFRMVLTGMTPRVRLRRFDQEAGKENFRPIFRGPQMHGKERDELCSYVKSHGKSIAITFRLVSRTVSVI